MCVCVWVHARQFQQWEQTVGMFWWMHCTKKALAVWVCDSFMWLLAICMEVTRCVWQLFCILLLLNMVKMGRWCTWLAWLVWDNLRRSSELSILIALSIKQKRQLGDSGRAQHCRKPTSVLPLIFCFVRALPSSAPPHPAVPPPPPRTAVTTQRAGEMGKGGEEWRREQKREKREST